MGGRKPPTGPNVYTRTPLNLKAPDTPGTYYYTICIDPVENESDTTNNCSTAIKITVQQPVSGKPDLVVESVRVSKSTLAPGESFTLSATVRNRGNGQSNSTKLRYYRSSDSTISTSDTRVGTPDNVGALGANRISPESVGLNAPTATGTYFYGACVDSVANESDKGNNCSSAVKITVQQPVAGKPDLVVESPRVSKSTLSPGESFKLSVTVANRGTAEAGSTTLRYYSSSDPKISTSDTQVDTDTVNGLGLPTGGRSTSDESVTLTAPTTPGTYYYGACVDRVSNEGTTNNNCSTAVKITVQQTVAGKPDLVVESPSVSKSTLLVDESNTFSVTLTPDSTITITPDSTITITPDSTIAPGGSFTLFVTVANRGTAEAGSTTLRYYRSSDDHISTSDTQVGTDTVNGLGLPTGDRSTSYKSIKLTAPTTPGTYYYGACVDSVNNEDTTNNNCSTAVKITVPNRSPDLVIEPSWSFLPPFISAVSLITFAPGDKFDREFILYNQGTGRSAATTLRYYRSDDDTIDTNDKLIGTGKQDPLPAGGDSTVILTGTAPDTPGTYYYGVCVDSVENESDTGNNCSTAVKIIVEPPSDDHGDTLADATPLSVGIVRPGVVDGSRLSQGVIGTRNDIDYFCVEATGAGKLTVWTTGDLDTVGELQDSAGNKVASDDNTGTGRNFRIQHVVNSSTYYVKVQGHSGNTGSYTLHVGIVLDDPDSTADLIAQGTWVSDKTLDPGESFKLGVAVMNVGDALSPATTLKYYRSFNDEISTTDIEVGTDAVRRISDDGKSEKQITLTAPDTPGTYYYGACVESVKNEATTNNNCSPAVKVTVVPPDDYGDTRAEATLLPLNGSLNGVIETGTDIDYFRVEVSEPGKLAVWTTGPLDTIGELQDGSGTVLTSDDDSGSINNFNIELANPVTAGTYYIKVESYLINTGKYTIHASFVQQPDLVVESPSVSKASLSPGESFTLSATVVNKGTGESSATTLRYYRLSDDLIPTLETLDTEVDTDIVDTLSRNSSSDESAKLTAPTVPGTYYYVACVHSVKNESDTDNNCSEVVSITVLPNTNTVVRVTPASITQGVGEPVTLKIDIADAPDIVGYNLTLEFDSAVLRYLGYRPASYYSDQAAPLANPNALQTLNKVTLEVTKLQRPEGGSGGTLALATFKVLQPKTSIVKLSNVKLTKKDGNVVYPGVEHGQITGTVLPPQQNIVRLIYFLPSDRVAQQNIDEKIDTLIRGSQQFFAEQMEQKNVHVRKTFTFETDAAGKAVVHQMNGALPYYEYYENAWDEVKSEVEAVFDTSRSLFFIAAELESICGLGGPHQSYDSGRWTSLTTKIGGIALIAASGSCFKDPTLTYHELGHAFGLLHDFRSDTYVMSYVRRLPRLSNCAAEWLDASRFFNSNQPLTDDEVTRIEMLPLAANRQKTINFTITDADGLHQVQLIVAPNDEKPPPGYPYSEEEWRKLANHNKQYLHACKRLNGESDTVEFSIDGLNADAAMLQVIDKYGNFVRQDFSLPSYDDGDTAADATPLPLDSSLAGEIETSTDVDYFRIEVNGPGTLVVHTTGSLDTMGELQDSSGAILASNDDTSGNNRNFRIKHAVTAGTYYIKVRGYDVDTGAYTVHARFVPDERVDVSQFMYWTSKVDGIQRANLDGSARDPFFSTETPIDIALDVAGEQIYWTDTNHMIQRANLDGTGTPEVLVSRKDFPNPENVVSFGAIALDVANNKMYWIVHPEEIWWANLDGSNPERLLTTKNPYLLGLDTEPSDIALDVLRNDIYWSEFSNFSTRIWRADLNGKNRQIIIDLPHSSHEIHGIALDVTKNKVYWTNSKGTSIWYANTLDGDPELLIDLPERDNRILRKPYDIALDVAAEQIYWTYVIDVQPDIIGYGIARSNIDGFGEPEVLFTYSPKDSSTGEVRKDGLLQIALGVSAMSDTNLIAGASASNVPRSRVQETALLPNYPNPFNPETWIPFQLATPSEVTITIYDVRGRVVRQLILENQPAGIYQSRSKAAHWDGRNRFGEKVATGVYFYTLKAGDYAATRKMLIRK